MQCVRPGVLLDAASVPSVRNTDRHGHHILLNRYILDYWTHGQKKPLTIANGMREGEFLEPDKLLTCSSLIHSHLTPTQAPQTACN